MSHAYNIQAPKKATSDSMNSDLLEKVRGLDINLSATLKQALAEELRHQQRAQWLRENANAMTGYNQFVESNGTFSDSVRKF